MFSFVKNRPPLVIFFLCVVTLTITIFCFAFYIKNTDPIPDSDIKYDWTQLLKHFNNLDACVESNVSNNDRDSFIEMSKVQTLVRIDNSNLFEKITTIKGLLTLNSWQSKCPKNYSKPTDLQIFFDVPNLPPANISKFDICVTIEGPAEYLPKFSKPNCKAPVVKGTRNVATLSTNLKSKHSDTFCKDGTPLGMHFYPQDKHNYASFLSENEKSIIYLHLLWIGYILLFLLLIIIVYGTLQSDYVYGKYLHKWVPFNNE